ncbi:MAG: hypothetical protein ACTSQJ_09855 [Promethearchaeota archaeon]
MTFLKPKSSFLEKMGYIPITSIGIANIIMFFNYLYFFDQSRYPDYKKTLNPIGFKFDGFTVVLIIQIFNLTFIIWNAYIKHKSNQMNEINPRNKKHVKNFLKNFELKTYLSMIGYLYSIIFLCISTLYSNVPNNDYSTIRKDYRSNLTFFLRVPFLFYIFLCLSIIFLIYICFTNHNKYISLFSLSLFIYCIWILPFLQIQNYFNYDSHTLYQLYKDYLNEGISNVENYGFCLVLTHGSLRYSTNLLTAILLTTSLKININQTLWYVFPLIYCGSPFFFYSIFNGYTEHMKKNETYLILLVILILTIPQILKSGHNASTGLLGIFIFFMLVIEFYNFIHLRKARLKEFIFIIILFFFLCLTHFEECIYFLTLILIYNFYLFFLNKIKINNSETLKSFKILKKESPEIIDGMSAKDLKKNYFEIAFLFLVLSVIFYFVTLFFGYLRYYFIISLGSIKFLNFIQFLFNFGAFFVSILIISILLYFLIGYLLINRLFNFILAIVKFFNNLLKKLFLMINLLFEKTFIQLLFFVYSCIILFYLDLNTILSYDETFLIVFLSLTITYLNTFFYIFFFLKGLKYNNFLVPKQTYYLISIFSSGIVIIFFFGLGVVSLFLNNFNIEYIWMAIYIIHTKFIFYFVFFNFIIIQNNFLEKLFKERKKEFYIFTILMIIIGIFSSLRALRFG